MRIKLSIPRVWGLGYIFLILLSLIRFWDMKATLIDEALHDTYYVVANFHYLLITGFFFLLFWLAYVFFEAVIKFRYNRWLAITQFMIFYIGVLLIFYPQFYLTLNDMPRRYIDYPESFRWLNVMAQSGGFLIIFGAAAFILVVIEALVKKRPIGDRDARIKRE